MGKETFIIKTRYKSVITKLSDKQAGILFKMLFEYVENGVNAGSIDDKVDTAFEFIKLDLDSFKDSYNKKVEANRLNGQKGGAPKGNSNAKKETTQNNPKQHDDNKGNNSDVKEKDFYLSDQKSDIPKENYNADKEDVVNIKNNPNNPKQHDNDNDNDNVIIKEKIVKEKSLSLSDRTNMFKEELIPFVEKYGKDMIFAFFDYWSEPNSTGTKMKRELQKTWNTAGRLRTWERISNGKR